MSRREEKEDAYVVEQALLGRPVSVRRVGTNEILFCCKRAVVVFDGVSFIGADLDRVPADYDSVLGDVEVGSLVNVGLVFHEHERVRLRVGHRIPGWTEKAERTAVAFSVTDIQSQIRRHLDRDR